MRPPAKSLSLLAGILIVAYLAAGCGGSATSVLSNVPTPSRTTPNPTGTATGGPSTPDATAAPASPTAGATVTVTSSPKVTAKPSVTHHATSTPVVSPVATATPSTGSGPSLLWLWILLAAAALIGLIAWITHAARRRSAKAAGWRSRLIDAYAKGSALHDAMSVAEAPGAAPGDAGARWADIQRRADDLTQTLYALHEAVPDPADQARIAEVLASLQAVRSAMDAERVPGGASPEQAQVVRSRLSAFELSLRALRGTSQEFI